jgi:hypothetical protein
MGEPIGVTRMTDRLEILAEILHEVEECRRLAIELKDRETAARMNRLAEDLVKCARRMLALRCPDDDGARSRKLDS